MKEVTIKSDIASTLLLAKHDNPKESDEVILAGVYGTYIVNLEDKVEKLEKRIRELESFRSQF